MGKRAWKTHQREDGAPKKRHRNNEEKVEVKVNDEWKNQAKDRVSKGVAQLRKRATNESCIARSIRSGPRTDDSVLPQNAIEIIGSQFNHREQAQLFLNKNWYRILTCDEVYKHHCERLNWRAPKDIAEKPEFSYYRFFKTKVLLRTLCEICGKKCDAGYLFKFMTICCACRSGDEQLQVVTKLEVRKKYFLDALDVANLPVDDYNFFAPRKYYHLNDVLQVAYYKYGGPDGFEKAKEVLKFELGAHLPVHPKLRRARMLELKLYKTGKFYDMGNIFLGFPLLLPQETKKYLLALSGGMSVGSFELYWQKELNTLASSELGRACLANKPLLSLIAQFWHPAPQPTTYCNMYYDDTLRRDFFSIICAALYNTPCENSDIAQFVPYVVKAQK